MKKRVISVTVVVLGLLGSLGYPAPVFGQTAPRARRAAAAQKPVVTVLVDAKAADQKKLRRLLEWIRKAVRRYEAVQYVPMQTLLEKPKGSLTRLYKADRLIAAAKQALEKQETAEAVQKLERAVRLCEYSFLGMIRIQQKTKPLARALRWLAVAQFQDGQTKEARQTIRRLLVVAPTTRYEAKHYPPKMAQLVDDERLMFDEFGSSIAEVKTEPAGARLYLNGHRVGRSPLRIPKVRRGFNYVTARLPGYRTTTMGIEVDPPKMVQAIIKLRRFKRDPMPQIIEAYAEMGRRKPGPGLLGLAKRLKVDMMVIGKAESDQDLGSVVLYLYDFRLNALVKGPIRENASADFPKQKILQAVRQLFAGVRLDGKRPRSEKTITTRKPTDKRPLWLRFKEGWGRFRRWNGFWPTVGTVTGVVVTAVVVGLTVGLLPRASIYRGSRHVVYAHPLARF